MKGTWKEKMLSVFLCFALLLPLGSPAVYASDSMNGEKVSAELENTEGESIPEGEEPPESSGEAELQFQMPDSDVTIHTPFPLVPIRSSSIKSQDGAGAGDR